jgi:hypothetical protein
MTVRQFLDYLAAFPQSRQLALVLAEVVDERRAARLRRSA